MAGYEVSNSFAIHGIKVEAVSAALGKLQARFDVIFARRGFAGVMEQQREIEQRRLLQFLQQLSKSQVPFRFRFLQTMQMFNREERMFVDGVAMVEITHH